MLEGINAFNEGLVEHGLIYRGELNNETLDQGIQRELSDMARLQPELHRIQSASKRVITQGIVTYATGFYLVMREKELAQHPQQYKQFIAGINEYFRKMDDKFYGELEGRPLDMEELAEYLNNTSV